MARAIASADSAWLLAAVSKVSTGASFGVLIWLRLGFTGGVVGDCDGRRLWPGVNRAGCPGIPMCLRPASFRRVQRVRRRAADWLIPAAGQSSLRAGEVRAIRQSWRQGRVLAHHRWRAPSCPYHPGLAHFRSHHLETESRTWCRISHLAVAGVPQLGQRSIIPFHDPGPSRSRPLRPTRLRRMVHRGLPSVIVPCRDWTGRHAAALRQSAV